MEENNTQTQIVKTSSDFLVVKQETPGGEWAILNIPSWFAGAYRKKASELEGAPLLLTIKSINKIYVTFQLIIEHLLISKTPVNDYAVEFIDMDNRERAILISAGLSDKMENEKDNTETPGNNSAGSETPLLFFRLIDITKAVIERKKYIGIGFFHGIIGTSRAMLRIFNKIEVYGATDVPVLITGETGTGKELIAQALHDRSRRRNANFVAVNCTALNEELFESELFGHEKGAFTGAIKTHKGRFERAHAGTLFLDEIGDMPLRTQAKILRVLETGRIERVGAEEEKNIDVRIVAATNIPLEEAVALKRFRADLYHRIAVFRIHIPPLRERPEDIPLLVDHFLRILNERYGKNIQRLSHDAIKLLQEYFWPGNIRELRNVLERVYVESQNQIIGKNAFNEWERERDYFSAGQWNLQEAERRKMQNPIILSSDFPGANMAAQPFYTVNPALQYGNFPGFKNVVINPPEKALPQDLPKTFDADYTVQPSAKRIDFGEKEIREALAKTGGNATQAAKLLGVHKATLYRKMNKLGLDKGDIVQDISGEVK